MDWNRCMISIGNIVWLRLIISSDVVVANICLVDISVRLLLLCCMRFLWHWSLGKGKNGFGNRDRVVNLSRRNNSPGIVCCCYKNKFLNVKFHFFEWVILTNWLFPSESSTKFSSNAISDGMVVRRLFPWKKNQNKVNFETIHTFATYSILYFTQT